MTICINGVAEVQLPPQAAETVLQNNPNAVLGPCPEPVVPSMPPSMPPDMPPDMPVPVSPEPLVAPIDPVTDPETVVSVGGPSVDGQDDVITSAETPEEMPAEHPNSDSVDSG